MERMPDVTTNLPGCKRPVQTRRSETARKPSLPPAKRVSLRAGAIGSSLTHSPPRAPKRALSSAPLNCRNKHYAPAPRSGRNKRPCKNGSRSINSHSLFGKTRTNRETPSSGRDLLSKSAGRSFCLRPRCCLLAYLNRSYLRIWRARAFSPR